MVTQPLKNTVETKVEENIRCLLLRVNHPLDLRDPDFVTTSAVCS
jgi:hypothetical protein